MNSAGKRLGASLALLLTALIWGLAFTAQRNGMAHLGPSAFNAIRSFIGFFTLLPVIMVLDHCAGRRISIFGAVSGNPAGIRHLLSGGILCGIAMSGGSLLQQYGLVSVPAGKSGFLTSLYIVMVPVLGFFLKRKTAWTIWVAALAALFGTGLLCSAAGGMTLSIQTGDLLLLGCALMFSLQIMVIDRFAPQADCVRMSAIQFLVTALLSLAISLFTGESWAWSGICGAMAPLLYCGLGSSGIGYTLQVVGQKYVHPAAASLLMSLEAVFAAFGGWLFLNEKMSGRELLGSVIIFAAVILAQLPPQWFQIFAERRNSVS